MVFFYSICFLSRNTTLLWSRLKRLILISPNTQLATTHTLHRALCVQHKCTTVACANGVTETFRIKYNNLFQPFHTYMRDNDTERARERPFVRIYLRWLFLISRQDKLSFRCISRQTQSHTKTYMYERWQRVKFNARIKQPASRRAHERTGHKRTHTPAAHTLAARSPGGAQTTAHTTLPLHSRWHNVYDNILLCFQHQPERARISVYYINIFYIQ